MIRRYIFTAMALTMNQYCSFQLFALMLLTMVQFEYLVLYKPFNTPLLQRLDILLAAVLVFHAVQLFENSHSHSETGMGWWRMQRGLCVCR